jgi:carbon storage regulator CsrA
MLILSRKKGQRILINNGEIILTILRSQKGKITMGFEAAHEIPIHREEIHQRTQQKKLAITY